MGHTQIVNSFKGKKVLVIGDTIIDIYTYCTVVCEALYAPIPEAEEIRSAVSFGGNSLVVSNILELGGTVTFVSVVGDDDAARHYDSFVHPKLRKIFLTDKTRKTTVKQRWFGDGKPLLQVNQVDNHELSPQLEKKVCTILEKEIPKADVVVIMDPQHGFLTKGVIAKTLKLTQKCDTPLYVDVQISHRESRHTLYRGAHTFFLNRREAAAVDATFSEEKPEASLKRIAKKMQARNVVVKLGEKGSVAFFGGKYMRTNAHSVDAVDVCGAGDAFLAAFALGDSGAPEHSLTIANVWGGLSTTIHGTVPPPRKELIKVLRADFPPVDIL